ncbi:hypothetical protein HanXRQr2_Chr15g0710121 [Helianthus annuus]|uniref:Uncharacterized protein n=1 Tax=Helianthus annuus TaxID=4232 RepID=A0A9K3E2U7_HELAN|nr:hypothetical protein HanXRQr2_Chr15g0710121 [Helianthus annuus]
MSGLVVVDDRWMSRVVLLARTGCHEIGVGITDTAMKTLPTVATGKTILLLNTGLFVLLMIEYRKLCTTVLRRREIIVILCRIGFAIHVKVVV